MAMRSDPPPAQTPEAIADGARRLLERVLAKGVVAVAIVYEVRGGKIDKASVPDMKCVLEGLLQ